MPSTPHQQLTETAYQALHLSDLEGCPVPKVVAAVGMVAAVTADAVAWPAPDQDRTRWCAALAATVASTLNPSTETAAGVDQVERVVRTAARRLVTAAAEMLEGDAGSIEAARISLDTAVLEVTAAQAAAEVRPDWRTAPAEVAS